jgi:tetratricopeptide (TPR) repeat protein
VLTDPQALRTTADAVAGAAEELAAAGDAAGEAKAHSVHALALARLGEVGACEAALDRALAAARRGHDRRRSNAVLAEAPLAALWGPSQVTRASGRCLDVVRVLRITQGAPGVEAVALRCQAVLEALRGRADAARRMVASSRRMVEELGITQGLLETEMFAGLIELIEGDTAAAEHSLRTAYEGLRSHGLGIDAARAAALLGRTLLAQGRPADAEAFSHESEALAGDDLQAAITWRRVRAEALARRGEHASAIDFARAAVDIAAATDALLHHADARLALATALRAAGRGNEAAAEQARAAELWEAKGATVLAERARRGIALAQPVQPAPVERDEPARPAPRRVRANMATAHAARFDAAFAARDTDALPTLIADEMEVVYHPTHSVYDGRESLRIWRAMLEARDGTLTSEVLATLGDSLALCRQSISASGAAGEKFDFGAYEIETIAVVEVDEQGRRRRSENFAADRLGDAIVRLYERYAELLPDGPERLRGAAIARSVAALQGPPDRWPFAPDAEAWDHRTVGFGPLHGGDAVVRAIRTLMELSDDFKTRIDDIVDLRPEALFVRWTTTGTLRAGGGTFERLVRMLWVFGADGRVSRWEQFDAEQDAEALARFHQLKTATIETATLPPARPARRVRANAATANLARFDAAFAARDADALAAHVAQGKDVDHSTGAIYEAQAMLPTWLSLLRAPDGTNRSEPLATLGDSLALSRQCASASGVAGEKFDVGAYQVEHILLFEVDAQGQHHRGDIFATNQLDDAIVLLYERYTELLPAGPARDRATATARSVAVLLGPVVPETWEAALASDVEYVDHRTLGLGSTRGAQRYLKGLRSLLEVAGDVTVRIDDILALHPDALLVRRTQFGTVRASGGAFERPYCWLVVFGIDGFATRTELFDTDREAEALARFDEVVGDRAIRAVSRNVLPNAMTAAAARLDAAMAARDVEALLELDAEQVEVVDHPTGKTYGREGNLASRRALLRAHDLRFRHEPMATLGDLLALLRLSVSASGVARGTFDVGAYERDLLVLADCDVHGRNGRSELFAIDRLGDAVARLYDRYAEIVPDGPARALAAATARSVAAVLNRMRDPDLYATILAPAVEFVDHQPVGLPPGRGAEAFLRGLRTLIELTDNTTLRVDDVLGLRSNAVLTRQTNFGTNRASGGAYERHFLSLYVFGADGLLTRLEWFAADHAADALARFDELTGEVEATPLPPARSVRRVPANAATAFAARLDAVVAARDADALPTLFAEDEEVVEHTTGATYGRSGSLSFLRRQFVGTQGLKRRTEPLATLGDSLAVCRMAVSGSGAGGRMFDVGAFDMDNVCLFEVDTQGRRRRSEVYATERLADAVARLYERYAELLPDGLERDRAAAAAGAVAALFVTPPDLERYRAVLAPSFELDDRRTMGLGTVRGVERNLRGLRALMELSDDFALRVDDILALRSDALIVRWMNFGTDRASGGRFERPFIVLAIIGPDGLITRSEWFDAGRDEEALARFDKLTAEPAITSGAYRRVRPNAATANAARFETLIAARNADAFPTFFTEDYQAISHMTGSEYGCEGALTTVRSMLKAQNLTCRLEPLASLGDSLALCRQAMSASGTVGGKFDVGAHEAETIVLIEVDEYGRRRRSEGFAPDRLGDAVARLYERYAELLPDGPERARAVATARSVAAIRAFDLRRPGPLFADDIEFVDHRSLGLGSAHGAEAALRRNRALLELADNLTFRVDDILGLRSDIVLWRATLTGIDRTSGGPFELVHLHLRVFGSDGLQTRLEFFDTDREDEALARFDELVMSAAEGFADI